MKTVQLTLSEQDIALLIKKLSAKSGGQNDLPPPHSQTTHSKATQPNIRKTQMMFFMKSSLALIILLSMMGAAFSFSLAPEIAEKRQAIAYQKQLESESQQRASLNRKLIQLNQAMVATEEKLAQLEPDTTGTSPELAESLLALKTSMASMKSVMDNPGNQVFTAQKQLSLYEDNRDHYHAALQQELYDLESHIGQDPATQAAYDRAIMHMDEGNVDGAIYEMEKLGGPYTDIVAPWVKNAAFLAAANDFTAIVLFAVLTKMANGEAVTLDNFEETMIGALPREWVPIYDKIKIHFPEPMVDRLPDPMPLRNLSFNHRN